MLLVATSPRVVTTHASTKLLLPLSVCKRDRLSVSKTPSEPYSYSLKETNLIHIPCLVMHPRVLAFNREALRASALLESTQCNG